MAGGATDASIPPSACTVRRHRRSAERRITRRPRPPDRAFLSPNVETPACWLRAEVGVSTPLTRKMDTMTSTLTYSNITERKRLRLHLAVHEAAHSVATVLLGGHVDRAQILDGKVFGLRGETQTRHLLPEPLVAFAGPWAAGSTAPGHRWPTSGRTSTAAGGATATPSLPPAAPHYPPERHRVTTPRNATASRLICRRRGTR